MTAEIAASGWLDGAKRMLKAAENAHESGDYEVSLFTMHLALEKVLKGRYVKDKNTQPPKTHDLIDICDQLSIELSEEQQDHLREITSFAAFARYGDDSWLDAEATEENVKHWLSITNDFFQQFHP